MGYYKYAVTPFERTEQDESREAAPAEAKLTRDEEAELKAE